MRATCPVSPTLFDLIAPAIYGEDRRAGQESSVRELSHTNFFSLKITALRALFLNSF
jgi:hypothetical protein